MIADEAPAGSKRASSARAVALVLLALPSVAALFSVDWFDSHEAASYPARIVEVRRCWEDGLHSARWFPDLAGGRGVPFLSFYAPLSFWGAAAFHAAGMSVVGGLKAVLVLAALVGVGGAYRLARLGLGPAASFAAAALWAYSPYLLRDLWTRGDVAEFAALGVFPWALFATLRLARRPGRRAATLAGLAGAIAILTHNVVALFTGLGMAVAAGVAGTFCGATDRGRIAAAAIWAGTCALALSAFFWGPALGEKRWVQLENLRQGYFEVDRHWVGAGDLLQIERPERVHRPGQAEPMTFGLGPVLLPLLFAPLAWRGGGPGRRRVIGLGATLFAGGVFFATPASGWLYESVPILRFVGLPWRFLGPASLGAALLAGAGVEGALGRGGAMARGVAAASIAVAAIVLTSDLLRPIAPLEMQPWMLDPAAYRQAEFTATAADEYLPIWATGREAIPFREGLAATGRARFSEVERGVARWRFRVEVPEATTVVLQDFFYPGWEATVGGEAVEVGPRPTSGHAQFGVGAGEWDVVARLRPTAGRQAWRWVSVVAWLPVLSLLGVLPGKGRRGRV